MAVARSLVVGIALALVVTAAAPARLVTAAPAPLPSDRLHFGLSNGPSSLGWMNSSGVPWRYRYTYLAGGLYNNPWPTWQDPAQPPGQYALDYMRNSAASNFIPVFPYYMLLQSAPRTGSEADDDFNNLNNATLMRDYYANFTLLMQKAHQFGAQVVVHIEPDLWGYLQQRSNNTVASNVSAAVASSGNADVAAYPNNVQGFAQALQHLRDAYAPNVLLAFHASLWSSMRDIASDTDPSLNAAAEADKTAAFFNSASPAGWDLVFNDVDDHDAAWWEIVRGQNRWWDPTNRLVPNFTRYLTWVSELHAKTARPQVAWQVPEGNQYFLTTNNTPGHYQDNIAEYFLNHTSDLSAAGLIAVLFGAGNPDQTTNEDTMHDGITNNNGAPTSDAAGWCNACNTHVSNVSDDDGGYLRMAVGRYYAPATAPSAPQLVSATAGDGSAVVTWASPASDGGAAITSYTVTVSTGGSVSASGGARSAVVSGLANGTAVSFTVTATNSAGTGPGAVSGNVTPSSSFYTGWFTWYDLASPGMRTDNIHLVNPGSSPLSGIISLPGAAPLPFTLSGQQQTYVHFPAGTIGGPVTVVASGRVVAAQRVQYNESFNEVDAQPSSAAAQDLWFSWADIASPGMLNDNVHLVNPTSSLVSGTVTVNGASRPFAVGPGAGSYVSFPAGTIGGPVHVHANSGKLLASQRVQYLDTFNEVAGRSIGQAASTVYFNWFDKASPGMLNDNVHLVNPGGALVTGRVVVGPVTSPLASTAFSVGPGAGTYVSFATIGGPVTVLTDAGAVILASQRVQYFGSFNEVLGHGAGDAGRQLAMPWYDLASPGMVNDNVHLLNPGGATATVQVTVGGVPGASRTVTLAPGAEAWVSFSGAIGGPLLVTADQPVLASQRVQYSQTFNEAAAG